MLRFYNIKNYIQKTFRFGWFIPFSNLLIVYGRYFLPYKTLKSISDYRNNLIEGKISSIVGDISYVPITMTSDGSAKIWVLWLQGEEKMPLIPKLCLASIRKYSGLHEVVLLSWETLDNYVKLPSRIKELYDKGNISAAHLSDIIRIHLLCTYGGFWIDSTVMLTSPLSEQIFSSSFYTMKSKPEGFYVSECRWSGFCLYMSKNHPLAQVVNSMLQNYWEKENWLIDYFMLDYLIDIACKTFPEIKNEIDGLPYNNPNIHTLAAVLCDHYSNEKFKMLTQDTSFFKLSWKTYTDEQLLSHSDNFYHYLKSFVK